VDLERSGRSREAVAAYRDVLARRPYHGASLNNLAMSLLKSGEPAEAERILARALEVAPHYYMVHFNLGLRRLEENKLKEARERFARAAWLNEKHPASRYEIAWTFLAEGDIPGALPHLRRARELGVDVAPALSADFPALAADPRFAEFRR
jgi:tetratricopeptide (TPR) repeat protein